jgi:hypothetical protein
MVFLSKRLLCVEDCTKTQKGMCVLRSSYLERPTSALRSVLPCCMESDARSLRGGGGELGNLKTLTYGFTTFTQSKTRTYYLDVQLRLF